MVTITQPKKLDIVFNPETLQNARDILENYGTLLPRNIYEYDAELFALILSVNAKHTGEFLLMKVIKYISIRNTSFEKIINILKKTNQFSRRI